MNIQSAAQNAMSAGLGGDGSFLGKLKNYASGLQQRLSGQASPMSGLYGLMGMNDNNNWESGMRNSIAQPQNLFDKFKMLGGFLSNKNVTPATYGANTPTAFGGARLAQPYNNNNMTMNAPWLY